MPTSVLSVDSSVSDVELGRHGREPAQPPAAHFLTPPITGVVTEAVRPVQYLHENR
jgi:hypothetical protein